MDKKSAVRIGVNIFLMLFMFRLEAATTVVSEYITFLQESGTDAVQYRTTRTGYANYSLWFKKTSNRNLDHYMYLFPNTHRWEKASDKKYELLKFPGGDFASLSPVSLTKGGRLSVADDGTYTFTNSDGKGEGPDGHYGVWNRPDSFQHIAYAWVIPESFDILSYESNRHGEWEKRQNTITYFGDDVNDLVFTIKYRRRIQGIFNTLKEDFKDDKTAKIEQAEDGVKVIVGATVLFPSGRSGVTEKGKEILAKIAESISAQGRERIIIEGHTDNVPIRGELKKTYPTNWELSSARSLAVLRYLAEIEIDESRLEARALGSHQPRDTNETAEGRTSNRRIELLIQDE